MSSDRAAASPMWLSHHHPDQYDRCVRLPGPGGRVGHVCRRCAVLYPLALLSAVVVLLLDPPSASLVAAMWLLPLPVMVEWVAEHLGRLTYSPTRQVALTALAAPALGAALAWHAESPFEPAAVAPALTWAAIGAGSALWGHSRTAQQAVWQEQHEADEARRAERLARLLADASPTER
jgi:hypothetical protein